MENTDKPSKLPLIITSSLTVLAIAAASAFGFLYFNEKNKPTSVVTQTVTKTKVEPSNDLPSSVTLLDSKQLEEKYTAQKDDKTVNYTTEVGKFSLSLPSSLGIVQEFEASDGNGAQTILRIGKRTGSLISYSNIPFSIQAIKVDENSKAESRLGDASDTEAYQYLLKTYGVVDLEESPSAPKETKESLAGQDAIGYEVTGLTSVKYIVFEKSSQLYVISYDLDESNSTEILKLVNSGLEIKG